ncbi:MAG TPA: UDP-N-acetylmuramoyl-tripeptide--D-alanyl-D-alanine ligase, partial [Chitinophagales bacterium]
YTIFSASNGITTDTRNIQENQLFFALKCEKFNANLFAENALKAGASYAIVDEVLNVSEEYKKRVIYVPNVLETMQQLGLLHRKKVNPKVIALTGSNGKTTTKELVANVLLHKYKTHYTKGNLNNHIGIPLTLLAMPKDTEIAVIEMGANHQGEIASYCEYVEPDFGLITNVGRAHLEGFGGEEGVLKGKTELYAYIGKHEGKLFVNDADERLTEKAKSFLAEKNLIFYGQKHSSFVRGEVVENNSEFLSVIADDETINTQLVGAYNLDNVLAAFAIGKYFDVEKTSISAAISSYEPGNARSQKVVKGTNTIILDAYNANPSSMTAALENFELLNAKNKVAIIGQMNELVAYSEDEHKRISEIVLKMNLTTRVFVGNPFSFLQNNPNALWFATTNELNDWYKSQTFENTTQLIKGSRSNGLEVLVK